MHRFARHLAFSLALLTVSSAHAGFEECTQFFYRGVSPKLPVAAPAKQRELCFDAFAVMHSGQTKTPVFVAERLSRVQLQEAAKEVRTDRFYEEARLPAAHRARLEDYKSVVKINGQPVKFDRGHMAPAGDMPTDSAMAQSFSLANMIPQPPTNNRKTWARIEKDTRKYVNRAAGNVYVITGPVYGERPLRLGPGQVWVPEYIYKLVYDPAKNRAWAHWLENTDEARASRPISYEELVRRTGIEFLPGVHPAAATHIDAGEGDTSSRPHQRPSTILCRTVGFGCRG